MVLNPSIYSQRSPIFDPSKTGVSIEDVLTAPLAVSGPLRAEDLTICVFDSVHVLEAKTVALDSKQYIMLLKRHKPTFKHSMDRLTCWSTSKTNLNTDLELIGSILWSSVSRHCRLPR